MFVNLCNAFSFKDFFPFDIDFKFSIGFIYINKAPTIHIIQNMQLSLCILLQMIIHDNDQV